MNITQQHIDKLNATIDAGLCYGTGEPVPGKMCVEAAVCYALDLPHSDDPPCVSRAVRAVKIRLNDSRWSSNTARAAGLRKLAIAQLGSAGVIDDVVFSKRLAELTIRRVLPRVLRLAGLQCSAERCAWEGTEAAVRAAADAADAAYAAYAANAADAAYAANAADAAARAAASAAARAAASAAYAAAYACADAAAYAANCDVELTFFADLVLEILIELKAPGIEWLN